MVSSYFKQLQPSQNLLCIYRRHNACTTIYRSVLRIPETSRQSNIVLQRSVEYHTISYELYILDFHFVLGVPNAANTRTIYRHKRGDRMDGRDGGILILYFI